jgi:hypothetical protein
MWSFLKIGGVDTITAASGWDRMTVKFPSLEAALHPIPDAGSLQRYGTELCQFLWYCLRVRHRPKMCQRNVDEADDPPERCLEMWSTMKDQR